MGLGWATAYIITALAAWVFGRLIEMYVNLFSHAVSKDNAPLVFCAIGFLFLSGVVFFLAFFPLDPLAKKFAVSAVIGVLTGFLLNQSSH